MNMKKLLLSSAIAVAMGVSGTAHAIVDISDIDDDATTDAAITYASEIDVASTGTAFTDAGTAADVRHEIGFSINDGSARFIRYELDNGATFTADPVPAFTDDSGGAAAVAFTKAAGGTGESFVVFEATASTADVAPDDTIDLAMSGVTLTTESAVTASYELFETATAATNNGTSLASVSGVVYKFASELKITVEDAGEEEIEVATNSKEFDDGDPNAQLLTTNIAQIQVELNGNFWTDSDAVVVADFLSGDNNLVISGDFSSVALDSNGDPDVSKVQLGGADADALTATSATFNVGQTLYADASEADVTLEVTGDDIIVDGDYTGLYDVTAVAGSDLADQSLGTVSTLSKNGDSAEVDMLLDPNGAFKNFVRITNASTVDGSVFIEMINDSGDSASFALSDVSAGGAALGADLAGGASTRLIPVSALVAAAQAEDSTFAIASSARNKFRVKVDGEFSDVRLNNVTLATDNTTFSTF